MEYLHVKAVDEESTLPTVEVEDDVGDISSYVDSKVYNRFLSDGRILTVCILYIPDEYNEMKDPAALTYGQAIYNPRYGKPFRADLGAKIAIGRALTALEIWMLAGERTENIVKPCSTFVFPHYEALFEHNIEADVHITTIDTVLRDKGLLLEQPSVRFFVEHNEATGYFDARVINNNKHKE
jgi:hypothetical protein